MSSLVCSSCDKKYIQKAAFEKHVILCSIEPVKKQEDTVPIKKAVKPSSTSESIKKPQEDSIKVKVQKMDKPPSFSVGVFDLLIESINENTIKGKNDKELVQVLLKHYGLMDNKAKSSIDLKTIKNADLSKASGLTVSELKELKVVQ